MNKRLEFPISTLMGLGKAITEDTDVFLLALSAVAPKKMSRALLVFVACRRLDSALALYYQIHRPTPPLFQTQQTQPLQQQGPAVT